MQFLLFWVYYLIRIQRVLIFNFFFLFLLNFFLSPRMKNNRVKFRFLCTLLQKKKKRSTMHASRFFVSTGGWKNDDRKIVVSTLR